MFAEVRLRRSKDFGGAAYSVDRRKQARIIATARHYLARDAKRACRFDVVLLERIDPRGSNGYVMHSRHEDGWKLAVK